MKSRLLSRTMVYPAGHSDANDNDDDDDDDDDVDDDASLPAAADLRGRCGRTF